MSSPLFPVRPSHLTQLSECGEFSESQTEIALTSGLAPFFSPRSVDSVYVAAQLTPEESRSLQAHYYSVVTAGQALDNLPSIFSEVLRLREFAPESLILRSLTSNAVRWQPGKGLSLSQFLGLFHALKMEKIKQLHGHRQVIRDVGDLMEALRPVDQVSVQRSDFGRAVAKFGLSDSHVDEALPCRNSGTSDVMTMQDIEAIMFELEDTKSISKPGSPVKFHQPNTGTPRKVSVFSMEESILHSGTPRHAGSRRASRRDTHAKFATDVEEKASDEEHSPLQKLHNDLDNLSENVVARAPGTIPLELPVANAWRQQDRRGLFSALEGFLAVASAKKIVDGAFISSGLPRQMEQTRPPAAVFPVPDMVRHRTTPKQAMDSLERNGVARDIVRLSSQTRKAERSNRAKKLVYDRLYPHSHVPLESIQLQMEKRLGVKVQEKSIPRRPLSAMSSIGSMSPDPAHSGIPSRPTSASLSRRLRHATAAARSFVY